MRIVLSRNFEKDFKKLRPAEKQKFKERRNLFLKKPFDPILNNHPLKGKYKGYRSINIAGDLRVIFRMIEAETAIFIAINTHDRLYNL